MTRAQVLPYRAGRDTITRTLGLQVAPSASLTAFCKQGGCPARHRARLPLNPEFLTTDFTDAYRIEYPEPPRSTASYPGRICGSFLRSLIAVPLIEPMQAGKPALLPVGYLIGSGTKPGGWRCLVGWFVANTMQRRSMKTNSATTMRGFSHGHTLPFPSGQERPGPSCRLRSKAKREPEGLGLPAGQSETGMAPFMRRGGAFRRFAARTIPALPVRLCVPTAAGHSFEADSPWLDQ